MTNIKDLYKQVDFGDIDGLYDPNLEEYFIDFGYYDAIINRDTFFVIGRKGTGKSAIYNWVSKQQSGGDILVSNLSFKEFPFERFLKLSDDDFARPNQYQSIWRNIIYSELARLICQDEKCNANESYKELMQYVDHYFGKNIFDLHKEITKRTSKSSLGLTMPGGSGSAESGSESQFGSGGNNITQINRRLWEVICAYLKTNETSKYVIQFDQLDDNYTVYVNNEEYFQSIISLFKAAYDINQTFRSQKLKAKVVVYLRSDIYSSINSFDAESARWDQYKLNLNFAIVNKSDWKNPQLLQIINKRITRSLNELLDLANPFEKLFDNRLINLTEFGKLQDVFKYIIHRTFHRPRDVVQFCIKIQERVKHDDKLYYRQIKDGEKEYSLWLLSEVENEIAPKVKDLQALYELLRLLGSNPFSMFDFKGRYARYKGVLKVEEEEMLRFLYNMGIIFNVNFKHGQREMYSIIRNERSVFNRDLKILIHPGFFQGLYTSKFATKG